MDDDWGAYLGLYPIPEGSLVPAQFAMIAYAAGLGRAMALNEDIERALDGCYEAVHAAERWPDALDLFARSVGAAYCSVYRDGPHEGTVHALPNSSGSQPAAEIWDRVAVGYDGPDMRQRGRPLVRAGRAVVIEDDKRGSPQRSSSKWWRRASSPTSTASTSCASPN